MRRLIIIAAAGLTAAAGAVGLHRGDRVSSDAASDAVTPTVRPTGRFALSKKRTDAQSQSAPAPKLNQSLPAEYAILLTRSIFAIDPAGPESQGAGGTPADSALALCGIMQQGDGYVAFIENTSTRDALQVHTGDSVCGGRIVGIDLSAIVFREGGRAARVRVGQTIGAALSTAPAATPAVAIAPTSSDTFFTAPAPVKKLYRIKAR